MKKTLPWSPKQIPLMLAPMQGLTNRALRSLFIEWVRPDVVFTEFVRVRPGSKQAISDADKKEVAFISGGAPLVVQLIGRDQEALIAATHDVQELGAEHLNINLGCPYGRMTSHSAGGALLKDPTGLPKTLEALRQEIQGSFSIKMRAGYENPRQVFELLPIFEETGVDFIIIHPRTVVQKYGGEADHSITKEMRQQTNLPVIANGDIFSAAKANQVLSETHAHGLMLGRGAIADPLLFERIRGKAPATSSPAERADELRRYLQELLRRYKELFCGDMQILCKMKEVLCQINDPEFATSIRNLKRSKKINPFCDLIDQIAPETKATALT